MDDLIVGILIAFFAALFGAITMGVAWVTKQVTEHSRWMAVANQRLVSVETDVARHDAILVKPHS